MIGRTLAWVAGLIWLHHLATLPSWQWLWLSPLLFFVRRVPALRLPAWVLLGFSWALIDAHLAMRPVFPAALENLDLSVVGEVEGLPEEGEKRTRFLFRITKLIFGQAQQPFTGLVRLSWYGQRPQLASGEQWHLAVRLRAPRGFSNPGGFDYEGWLYRAGIRATGYVRTNPDNRRLTATRSLFRIDGLRERLRDRQGKALGESPFLGLIRAVTIGDRGAVSDAQWTTLRLTGTTHLLAISGLHIAMLAGLAFLLVRFLWVLLPALPHRLAAPRVAGAAALVAAAVYAALAGFTLPTQRALVMVAVFTLGLILGRTQRPLRSFAVALLVVTMLDSKSVVSPGFWLSFGAVAFILYATMGRFRGSDGWRWFRVQWVVALGLTPLLIGFFGQASLIAPLANLLAIPWVGFVVVPLSLAGTALAAFSLNAGESVLSISAWLLQGISLVLESAATPSFAAWQAPEIPLPLLVAAVVGLLLLFAPRGIPFRWAGIVMLVPLVVYPGPPGPGYGAFHLTLLDVGQGLAVVVRTRNHTLVYDTGPRFSDRFDTGAAVVVPYLRSRGVGRIDRLLISHGDNDHAGGAASVTRLLEVGPAYRAPRPGEALGPEHCRAGDRWEWDGVRFLVLHPDSAYKEADEENNHSCVLRIAAGRFAALLTGDIEREAESLLAGRQGAALQADLLVVPHHGSSTSSSLPFLQRIRPRLALVGSGYKNRWGFPSQSVEQRYRSLGVPLMSTADWGAIKVVIDEHRGVSPPVTWRSQRRRYWHAAFGGGYKSSNIAPSTVGDTKHGWVE